MVWKDGKLRYLSTEFSPLCPINNVNYLQKIVKAHDDINPWEKPVASDPKRNHDSASRETNQGP